MAGKAVGMDLGTTNSVVAVAQGGRARVLPAPDGTVLIPSVVSFHPNGQTIVGTPARARRAIDPANTVFSVKRLLGRPFASEEVRRASERFAFELREGPDQAILVHSRAGDLSLPEISAFVLREVRRIGEQALAEKIDRAIVTVPANFNELQRSATKAAGQIADIDVIRILNEPTAAALAYGYGRGTRERIAIYDFGGGTFDVTLLELSGNVFEVLATAGDTFLGGDDLDMLIADNLADGLMQSLKIDARQDRRAYEMLRAAAEQAKIELSTADVSTIKIPEIGYGPSGRALEFRARITRQELERVAEPLISRTLSVCAEALRLAGLRAPDFGSAILVGGSSRMPSVRARVAQFFGKDPLMSLPPEHVVAMGASILAEALTGGRKKAQTTLGPGTTGPAPFPQTPSARPPSDARPASRTSTIPDSGAPAIRPRGNTLPGATRSPMYEPPTQPSAVPAGGVRPSQLTWGSPSGPSSSTASGDEPTGLVERPGGVPGQDITHPRYDPSRATQDITKPRQLSSLTEDAGDEEIVTRVHPRGVVPPVAPEKATWSDGGGVTGATTLPHLGGAAAAAVQAVGAGVQSTASLDRQVTDRELPVYGTVPTGADPLTEPRHRNEDLASTAKRAAYPFPGDEAFPDVATSRNALPVVPPAVAPVQPGPGGKRVTLGGPDRRRPDPRAEEPTPAVLPTAAALAAIAPEPPWPMTDPRAEAPDESTNPNAPVGPPSIATPDVPRWTDSFLGFPAVRPPDAPPMAAPVVIAERPPLPPPAPPPAREPPAQFVPPSASLATAQQSMPAAARPMEPSPPPMPQPAPAPMPPAMSPPMRQPMPSQNAPSVAPSTSAPSLPPGPLLLDVTPHSLGIETVGGLCEMVIARNATIPVEQTREFATAYDGQEGVRLRISQGESRKFGENQPLGELELIGISRAPRGEVVIAVTFEIDANGTLGVRAREVQTGLATQTRLGLLTMPSAAQMAEMAQRQRGAN